MSILPEQLPANLSLLDSDCLVELESRIRWLPNQRGTYLGRYDGQPALIKCYPRSCATAQRDFSRELKGVHALTNNGITTPPLLYQGQLAEGHYCVITEFLIDSVALDSEFSVGEAHDRVLTDAHITSVGQALGEAIYSLHAVGLEQKDAHLGNFLYQNSVVWVVDGAGIAPIGRWFNRRKRLRNLALVLAQLPVTAGVLAQALVAGYGDDFTLIQIHVAVDRQRRRREQRYLRKTLRSCSEFKLTRHQRSRQLIRRDQLAEKDLQQVLSDLERAMAEGMSLKKGNSATLVKIRPGGRWLVIKRYNIKSVWHRLRRLLRTTRAARSWQNGYRLTMWGVRTPLPLAMVEQRFGPLRGRSYLVCEYTDMPGCSEYQYHPADDDPNGERLIKALAGTVAALKSLGLSHGDLKADNLKFDGQSLLLLDLDSLVRLRSRRQLHRSTRGDCQRLLRNWVEDTAFADRLKAELDSRDTGFSAHTGFINA